MYPLPLRPDLGTQAEYTAEWLEVADTIGSEKFSEGLVKAVRESEYFPTIAKLRNACGITDSQQLKAGADAAWQYVQKYIGKGYACDWCTNPPPLPARIAYAAKAVGGIQAIQNVTIQGLPFQRKDFCEAWERYQESSAALGDLLLSAPLEQKLLPMPKRAPSLTGKPESGPEMINVDEALQKAMRMPSTNLREMTAADFEDRKEILRQQAETLKANGGIQ